MREIIVQGVKNHKIRTCGQNLHSKPLELHICSVWVDTQLKQLLLGVLYALCAIFLGLNMLKLVKLSDKCGPRGQKSLNPHLRAKYSL